LLFENEYNCYLRAHVHDWLTDRLTNQRCLHENWPCANSTRSNSFMFNIQIFEVLFYNCSKKAYFVCFSMTIIVLDSWNIFSNILRFYSTNILRFVDFIGYLLGESVSKYKIAILRDYLKLQVSRLFFKLALGFQDGSSWNFAYCFYMSFSKNG